MTFANKSMVQWPSTVEAAINKIKMLTRGVNTRIFTSCRIVRVIAVLAVSAIGMHPFTGLAQSSVYPSSSILWGIGDEVPDAQKTPLYNNAPVNMVTAWFNGPNDLKWMQGYQNPNNSEISQVYGAKKAIEVIVWLADGTDGRSPAQSSTSGQTLPQYALSPQFLTDLQTIIAEYKGNGPNYGPMYVVLFTEFNNTYPYNWPGSPYTSKAQYEAALMRQYVKAANQIHAQYAQAKVALGFGGYMWLNTPYIDMTPYIAAINASDFTASQAMHSCENERLLSQQITNAVRQLGKFGKPVMISHFKTWKSVANPKACSEAAMADFVQTTLNRAALAKLKADGLWAWDFMNGDYIVSNPGPAFDSLKALVTNNSASSVFPSIRKGR